MMKITIIGCGWLGYPLAHKLLSEGHYVLGTTTTPSKVDLLQETGIDATLLNLDSSSPIDPNLPLWTSQVFIIAIPPKVRSLGEDHLPKITSELVRLIPDGARVIFVSSTSVYPDEAGVYEEDFPLNAENTGNQVLFRAETIIAQRKNHVIVRPGGLMGEQRISGRWFAGKTVGGQHQPVNYLHQVDAVAILSLLATCDVTGCLNLVSPEHPTREQVYQVNSQLFGFEMPRFNSEGLQRIISSTRVVSTLGYKFQYPDPLKFH